MSDSRKVRNNIWKDNRLSFLKLFVYMIYKLTFFSNEIRLYTLFCILILFYLKVCVDLILRWNMELPHLFFVTA